MAYGLQEKRMKNTDMILKVHNYQIWTLILSSFEMFWYILHTWTICCQAAYNVGGLSVNAQIIQNSIIGCQSHRTSVVWFTPAQCFPPIIQRQTHLRTETNKIIDMQWVRTLFTPLKKSASGSSIHPYALHPPEPLAHFALSTGAISDPPVSRIDMLKFWLQSDHNILTVKSSAGEAVHCQESESSTGSSQDWVHSS